MTQGFIKLYREKGRELLEKDPQAYLLLTQIAYRSRRTDDEYSKIPLKINQALIGDHEKAGLSRQQYRNAQKRLTRYGLATFERSGRGTIATLTSTEVYDINADLNICSNKPTISPMEMQENEPTNNQMATIQEPINNHLKATETPLTRMEEHKKTTTTSQQAETILYECLQNHQSLSLAEKQGLLVYPEQRVVLAIQWCAHTTIKTSLIQTLHWYCRKEQPPLPPNKNFSGQTAQQNAAWEYNQFLEGHGQDALSEKNKEAIPQHHIYLILDGKATTITLKNSIDMVKSDLSKSMEELLNRIEKL